MTPTLTSTPEWPVGVKHKLEYYDTQGQELPDLPWSQVYAFCDLDGKFLLPVYDVPNEGLLVGMNLIGGHSEQGETAEQTLRREILEEANCEVISWAPLGYQKVDDKEYQLRVYAKVKSLGKFTGDPGSDCHIDNILVELEEINDYLKWGEVGDYLVRQASKAKSDLN